MTTQNPADAAANKPEFLPNISIGPERASVEDEETSELEEAQNAYLQDDPEHGEFTNSEPLAEDDGEDPYRFTKQTPDLARQSRSPIFKYILVAAAVVIALGAAAYFGYGALSDDQEPQANPQLQQQVVTDRYAEAMHERIVENRDAINQLINATSSMANENARMGVDLGTVAGAVQQVQLPRMAQTQSQVVEKTRQLELQIQRLEEENNQLKRNQGDTLRLEQRIEEFERELVEIRQVIDDQSEALDDTRKLAEQNHGRLQEINATPIPTDPVVRLAVCMNQKLPSPPGRPDLAPSDFTEQFLNKYRAQLETGELTMAAVEIRLASCLQEAQNR